MATWADGGCVEERVLTCHSDCPHLPPVMKEVQLLDVLQLKLGNHRFGNRGHVRRHLQLLMFAHLGALLQFIVINNILVSWT